MKRTASLLMAVILIVSSFAVIPASAAFVNPQADSQASSASSLQADNSTNNTSNGSIAPGAHLSGAVGVQESEIQGEVESRAFGIKVAKAKTANAKAKIVAEQLNESQKRVEKLEQRLDRLKQARQNGSISQGQYAARAAKTHAQLNNVQHMANKTGEAAEGIPNETLRANGVNVTAIKQLRERAANLSGPEVAAIAKTIAGPSAGERPGKAGNRTAGPDAGNQTAGNQTDAGNRTAGGDRGGNQTGDRTTSDQPNETTTSTSTPQAGDRQ